jgi:uncharacterized membrane protein
MEATSAGEAPAKTPTSTMLSGIVIIAGAIVFLWFAPSAYTVYKALHVVAILVWVGGDVTLTTLGIVFERRRDAGALAELGKMGAWIGTRVYTPALFAAFAFGVAMIEKGNLGWGVFWLDFALVVWALSFAIGAGYLGPTAKKIHAAYEASGGAMTPEIQALQNRVLRVIRFDAAMLLLIVVDMVAKPTF